MMQYANKPPLTVRGTHRPSRLCERPYLAGFAGVKTEREIREARIANYSQLVAAGIGIDNRR